MCVGGVNKKASGVRQKRIEQESRIQERQQNEILRKLEHQQVLALGDLSDQYIQGSASTESGDDDSKSKIEVLEDRNLTPISIVAVEADRYGISNRAAALIDYGSITSDNKMNIINHHKVWKARQSSRRNLMKGKPLDDLHISAVFLMEEKI